MRNVAITRSLLGGFCQRCGEVIEAGQMIVKVWDEDAPRRAAGRGRRRRQNGPGEWWCGDCAGITGHQLSLDLG